MARITLFVCLLGWIFSANSQDLEVETTNLAGVYKGETLFIQNPYNPASRSFCIDKIIVNNEPLILNYNLSALKLDFDGYDLYTPINVSIFHADSVCKPVIINPEAVLFHTVFRFSSLNLTDSALTWSTKGERGVGSFEIEKLMGGIWVEQERLEASGVYEGKDYAYFPRLEEGANKYRIRYVFPAGSRARYLFSWEVDYDHYPEPVEFSPHSAKTRLYLSRATPYEIYDANSELVLTGQGVEIDVTVLRQGQYVIYFDGRDPGTFIKE